METRINYTLIGLFVIVLGLLMIFFILWFSVGTEQKLYTTYQVFIRESVSGLNPKASVKYRGVDVGFVDNIALLREQPDKVRLLLKIEAGTPINIRTTATLASQGLTGLAYVELSGEGHGYEPPLTAQAGEKYPVIASKPSLLMRLDSTVSQLLGDLNKLSTETGLLISPKNRQLITMMLQDLQVITGSLSAQKGELDKGMHALSGLLINGETISTQLVQHLPALLSEAEHSLQAMTDTAQHFQQTADSLDLLANKSEAGMQETLTAFTTALGILNGTAQDTRQILSRFNQQTLPQVNNTLSDLRGLMNSLRTLSQTIQKNPNAVVFGRPRPSAGPGE